MYTHTHVSTSHMVQKYSFLVLHSPPPPSLADLLHLINIFINGTNVVIVCHHNRNVARTFMSANLQFILNVVAYFPATIYSVQCLINLRVK